MAALTPSVLYWEALYCTGRHCTGRHVYQVRDETWDQDLAVCVCVCVRVCVCKPWLRWQIRRSVMCALVTLLYWRLDSLNDVIIVNYYYLLLSRPWANRCACNANVAQITWRSFVFSRVNVVTCVEKLRSCEVARLLFWSFSVMSCIVCISAAVYAVHLVLNSHFFI